MRFAITTFGCQMNVHDSERMQEVLRSAGGRAVDGVDEADVVINTCSVREKAEQKLYSEVGRLAKLKRRRPDLTLVVAGCLAQQEGDALVRRMPAVDLVVGPDNIAELPELLADLRLGGVPRVRTVFDIDEPRFLTAPTVLSSRATAFVTTMKGCNERCSFCVVPYTRGPERYRPSSEILQEIATLVESGVREVTLLGQTVNSYRDPQGLLAAAPDARADDPDESEFAALLWAIAERAPLLSRLRYTSPHPRHLTASLIRAHRELQLLPRHVHLPVQSGSDRMLKRMIRRHTRADYLERLARLRAAVPGVTVSTDIIVGFPGETEDDFEATLSLVREAGHTGVFGFMYSQRPHTPALRLGDDVGEEVKRDRLARLFELSEGRIREHLSGLVGGVERVLVEGVSPKQQQNLSGRSGRNEIVHIEGAAGLDLVGEIVEVSITRAFKHSLLGRLLDDAPRPRRRVLPLLSSSAA